MMLLAGVLIWSLVAQAEQFPPFEPGASDATFEKSSPKSEIDFLKSRFHFKVEVTPYNIAQEKFRILVPKIECVRRPGGTQDISRG